MPRKKTCSKKNRVSAAPASGGAGARGGVAKLETFKKLNGGGATVRRSRDFHASVNLAGACALRRSFPSG